jgi:DNA mismatch endonuclease (patch repair protein)
MADIRQAGTEPELAVRRVLTRMGLRYRVKNRDLPGSPDLANRSRRWAVFVHGCYWHRHRGCKRTTTPTRNRAFWQEKFAANVHRDRKVLRELRALGYSVLVVWECEAKAPERLVTKLNEWVQTRALAT